MVQGRRRKARYGAGLIGLAATVALAFPIGAASGVATGSGGLSGDGAPSASAPTAVPGSGSAWEQALGRRAPQAVTPRSIGSAAVPALTVTPATGLVTGQVVDVAGTGFAAGELAVAECAANPTGPESCDLRTVSFISPDPSGAVSLPFTAVRTLLVSGRVVRCETAPGACTLIVTNIAGPGIDAFAPLSFASGPRPNPQIVVAPNTNLVGGDTVTVTGTGFQPNGLVQVEQCVVGVPFCNASTVDPTVNGTGGFSAQLPLSLRTVGPDGEVTTCLAVQCVVEAVSITDIEDVAVAEIDFDPNQPAPSDPTITVAPATGLHHNQNVTVTGHGFDPQADVEISQCGPVDVGFCSDYLTDVVAGADGTFTTTVQVSRLTTNFDPFSDPPATTIVDCAAVACAINADEYTEAEFSLSARASIAFDGSVPPPALPVVTAAPLTNLPYRASVTVHGTGFSPGEEVGADVCLMGPTSGTCGGFGSATADANGAVTLTVPVRRTARGFDGEMVDCVDPAVSCQLSVFGQRSYEQFEFPLTFDPNAPIPPPPTVSATPTSGLGYRQPVTVHGTGFAPDAEIEIAECSGDPSSELGQECSGFASVSADHSGGFETTFPARRFLGGPFSPAVDCASAATPCVLTVFDSADGFGGDGVSIPLSFDPNSVAPPPPHLEVSPDDHLHDGDAVDVRGSKFSPNAVIAVLECVGSGTSIGDCDFSQPLFVTADGQGRFTQSATVRTTLQSFSGAVDCAADGCELLAFNLEDNLESAAAPLSFDVPEIDLHSVSVREGTGGVTAAPVDVELSESSTALVTLHWNAVAGSATEGADYTSVGGTVVIPAGVTHGTIPAEIVADALDEPTERFTVVVDAVTGATIEDGDATVKIKDDDHEPDISIGDNRAREDAGVVDVPVILSAPSGRTVTVEFRTHHRSARSDHDFIRTRGVATFAPGQTLALVSVPIVDDTRHEKVESFRIELDDAEHADIADDSATVTIVDND